MSPLFSLAMERPCDQSGLDHLFSTPCTWVLHLGPRICEQEGHDLLCPSSLLFCWLSAAQMVVWPPRDCQSNRKGKRGVPITITCHGAWTTYGISRVK